MWTGMELIALIVGSIITLVMFIAILEIRSAVRSCAEALDYLAKAKEHEENELNRKP